MITRACPEGRDYSEPRDLEGLGPTAERANARQVNKRCSPGVGSKISAGAQPRHEHPNEIVFSSNP